MQRIEVTDPKVVVSVLMPVYNCEKYVSDAVSSILNQTFSDLELVICDDGSTDATWQVLQSFKDSRLRIFRNEFNRGYLATYNFLMRQVRGAYFTFQDADDWSDISRLDKQLSVFSTHRDIDLCACNGTFYYTDLIQRPCPPFPSGYISLKPAHFEFMLPPILYRSKILDRFGQFHSYFDGTTGGDQYFILEVLSEFKGYALNEYLYVARFNPTSNHRTYKSLRKMVASDIFFLLKQQRATTGTDWLKDGRVDMLQAHESKLLSDRRYLAEKFREYAVYQVDAGRIGNALGFLIQSLSSWPFWGPSYRTAFYALKKAFGLK